MATTTHSERPSASDTEDAVQDAIRRQQAMGQDSGSRLQDMAIDTLTGVMKLAGLAFIAVIAGYSAGVGSENCKERFRRQRERQQDTAR